ncbi:hypothetical protein SADUNF_Sadunf09G0102100 [Salix dunnii]|uniref:NADH dehydrogenase [ubiquinone] 1 beta subcomplex subunit 9 n=1 Tax=Salix dunnii TaxID=1413687 RepID=A0A835JVY0_9ROSI|nr:hypothetical protein SADUNF_Sadunf09G0102100 [Salix dunnii]
MSVATATYLARRAAQKERVRILYRRALKDTLNWAVHRHLFYEDADLLRARFETNKHVEDPDTIDRLIADGEVQYNKWRHPDPYIVPWAPGGSKFTRNPTPPEGMLKPAEHEFCRVKNSEDGFTYYISADPLSAAAPQYVLMDVASSGTRQVHSSNRKVGTIMCDYGGGLAPPAVTGIWLWNASSSSGFKLAKHSSRYVAYSDWAFCIEEAGIHKSSKQIAIQNLMPTEMVAG